MMVFPKRGGSRTCQKGWILHSLGMAKESPLVRGIKAAINSMHGNGTKFSVAGKPVRCVHCASETFAAEKYLLNTRGATFLNLDWMNEAATTLVCTECGRMEWFIGEPERRD